MPALDHDRCYRALAARDARFDGQFIAGVHSTGIYCRPSCPAATPRPHNVRFYPTAAAAHEAGLRACKRCQPDAVPGNPDWNLRDDLAGRAMRLIVDGVVERDGVPGLAQRLGYSTRHLTRVLGEELGAGPLALARAHRAEAARTLLAATDLPIAQVAHAAGFASIRQFNDTVREIYRLTPIELRQRARRARDAIDPAARAGGPHTPLTLRLAARAPFDGAGVLRYIADHAVPGVERVLLSATGEPRGAERWITLPGGPGRVWVELDAERAGVRVTAALATLADVAPLTARVRRWFDLDADAEAIDAALGADALLGPLVAAVPGIRIPGAVDPAETLLRTIVGQQISLPPARTVLGRLAAELAAEPAAKLAAELPAEPAVDQSTAPPHDDALLPFPSAAAIAEHGARLLRGPAARVRAVVAVAEALASGELVLDVGMTTAELRASLLRMPGIGPWTADYVALRVLGSPDLLLATDLVLLRTLRARGAATTPAEAAALGTRWAPWRSYATLHLWRAAPPAGAVPRPVSARTAGEPA
ncbi:AlkA N-terminal domain-containing protein [Microcella frigidaquae]|uniref:DNA-3-methyladenine glycosylase II n=1 Tax=Microcella frigidaquae TaxID=424758 RepID=A0A840XMC0_9MICO|nr:AraC family transcriptional regulator of adaptative response / DNA-3-methyladenine glycosylase II [Microcella frigidaquae]NHN45254.1 helix-turn-helix domain-containing protein [Microcella frigidaquae]